MTGLVKFHVEDKKELDNHCAILGPRGPALSRHIILGMFHKSLNPSSYEVSSTIIPMLKMRSLKHNEVNTHKGHMSGTVKSDQKHYSFAIPCCSRLQKWSQSFTVPCPHAFTMSLCSYFHQKMAYFPTSSSWTDWQLP